MKCSTCGQTYTASCDYRQGRCPGHPAWINISQVLKFFSWKKS